MDEAVSGSFVVGVDVDVDEAVGSVEVEVGVVVEVDENNVVVEVVVVENGRVVVLVPVFKFGSGFVNELVLVAFGSGEVKVKVLVAFGSTVALGSRELVEVARFGSVVALGSTVAFVSITGVVVAVSSALRKRGGKKLKIRAKIIE